MIKVLIKKIADDSVVESIKCNNERQAERIVRGVNINLNHEEYYTEIEKENE